MRLPARAAAAMGAAAIVLAGMSALVAVASAASATIPTAVRFDGISTVGALFSSMTSVTHGCTASVVDSPEGNLLMTAAHCLDGSGVGSGFAPGYYDGKQPYGRWEVVAAYGAPTWIEGQAPNMDFAFLVVASQTIDGKVEEIQNVTGANTLGAEPSADVPVTVPAYDIGKDDRPITCTTDMYFDSTYPAFDCNPYLTGTSGAPWLHRNGDTELVVGLIGGLHQGGCFAYTSYSPPFRSEVRQVYRAAVAKATASVFPHPGGAGC